MLNFISQDDGDHEVQDGGVCPRDIHLGENVSVKVCDCVRTL